jgi:two-component system NarL family sensor kinase
MASDPPGAVAGTAPHRVRTPGRERRRSPLRGELVVFLTVAVLALLAIAVGIIVIGEQIARDSALEDAETAASRIVTHLLEPLLADALDDRPGQREALDRVIAARLTDGALVLVIVSTPEGRVLYSSEPGLEGQQLPPSDGLSSAVAGHMSSGIDDGPDLGHPDVGGAPLLEVFEPMTIDDRRLVLEAHFTTDMIERDIALLRGQIVPLAVGAVALLQLFQIPIVVSLGRRLSRHEAERIELVNQHLAASDRERRMIAADLHDGPVQDLAGVTFALSALRPSTPQEKHASVDRMLTAVRSAVVSLRRLMVDIYPPDLSGPGLAAAIDDLAVALRERGVTVHVSERALPEISSATAAVLYRTAREALANVARHAHADTVWICLEGTVVDGSPAVLLTIEDDGVGLTGDADPPTPGDAGDGHLGLRLVHDRVVEEGGAVSVEDRSSGGTVLQAIVPVET